MLWKAKKLSYVVNGCRIQIARSRSSSLSHSLDSFVVAWTSVGCILNYDHEFYSPYIVSDLSVVMASVGQWVMLLSTCHGQIDIVWQYEQGRIQEIFEATPTFVLTTPISDQRLCVLSYLSCLTTGSRPEIENTHRWAIFLRLVI